MNKYYRPNANVPKMLVNEISEMMFFISKNYKHVNNKLAEQHILALGRRYSMISDAYISIAQLFYREPSSEEEMRQFNIFLNSFYINIFGSIDNLSWLVYFERIYLHLKVDKRRISIFNSSFIKICKSNGISIDIINTNFSDWYKDLKLKRDPIAHQIPLFIPFRIITNDDQKDEYLEIEKNANEKLETNDTHGYFEIMYLARKIGDFIPNILLVDSEEETLNFIDFRDLVNNDITKLNEIVKTIIIKLYN